MTNRFPFLIFGDLRGHVDEIRYVRVFCVQRVSLVDTVTYSTSLNQTKPSKIKHFLTIEVIGSDGNKCDVAHTLTLAKTKWYAKNFIRIAHPYYQ